jgi:hypothetical protein
MTFSLTHAAYCGMSIPHGEFETRDEARTAAARIIRRRRRQGFPVTTLDRGERWEIEEPDDCFMVPDQCGVLSLSEMHEGWFEELM